ncbi:glycosyltransferase family 39 protein [Geobacter sp. AOG2]|uniref:ArnT family glycosyltransferase n=1 Tax=Geobacter sp. AOG2 TaxID=1566347 RepID=UPI001CC3B613|nr:glycosyltransferase family 39 protein [Geobacter sp. AOG2]GFE62159.1 hypothetical protein AOG2_27470 [Geobacter sp. AOG2]
MKLSDTESSKRVTYLQYILLALVLGTVAYVRIRLLQVPLERDEGEYAYMGQQLLNGIPPYAHAYSMKLPGVSIVYALCMALFGQTPFGIHLGLLIANGICIMFVYLLASRLFDRDAAFAACASYAVLSLSKTVYGFFAHATHFIVLFALAGCLLLLRHFDGGRSRLLFISGLCFGLAFTMKQHAALFIVFAFLYLAWRMYKHEAAGGKTSLTGIALFLLGAIIPYTLIILWVLKAGTFETFWFWTVTYAREYASSLSISQGIEALVHNFSVIYYPNIPLWLLACTGALLLSANRVRCKDRLFVAGLFFTSFLAICPGFYFRWHYFIVILPATALLIGAASTGIGDFLATVKSGNEWLRRMAPAFLIMAAIVYGLYREKSCFFFLTPQEVSYSTYGASAFPAAAELGRYLKDHTTDADRIAVLGSEPEIYFYTGRLPATGYIYMYSLMEDQPHAEQMQRELIREIEQSQPKYCVFTNMQFSWLRGPFSPDVIFKWFDAYVKKYYERVGIVDLYNGASLFVWEPDAAKYTPGSDANLVIYKRKQ